MKHRLPRVHRGRPGFVLGLVLIVAALVAPDEGRADPATLILPDVCDDPAAVFDHQWAKDKFGASDLFFMANDGSVVRVSEGDGDFNSYEDLYVFAHGASNSIGGMTYANFVGWLKTAHSEIPKSVFFGVCGSATKPNSLLEKTYDIYDKKVDTLTGSDGACALTGDGDRDLRNAEYHVGVVRANKEDQKEYSQIIKNIDAKWNGVVYPGTTKVYKIYCQAVLTNFDAGTLRAFMATVKTQFSQPNTDPKASTDYLELVVLNTDGQELSSCGQDPTGGGPVACD